MSHRNINPFNSDFFEDFDGGFNEDDPMLNPTGYPAMDQIDCMIGKHLILHAGPTEKFPSQKIYTLKTFIDPDTGLPALKTSWGFRNSEGDDVEINGEIVDPCLTGIIFRPMFSIFGEGGHPTSH